MRQSHSQRPPRRAKLGGCLQPAVGHRACVISAPLCNARIEIDELGIRPDEVCERAEHDAVKPDGGESDGQSESRRDLRIERCAFVCCRGGMFVPAVYPRPLSSDTDSSDASSGASASSIESPFR